MSSLKRRVNSALRNWGLDARFLTLKVARLPGYVRQMRIFRHEMRATGTALDFSWGKVRPMLADVGSDAGEIDSHYFTQDLYVARKIFDENPARHIDVGSRVDGFVSHVATFRSVEVMDLRDLRNIDPQIRFTRGDITDPPQHLHGAYDSVSCLHALEHIGLGRYGDELDPNGWLRALDGLSNLLRSEGLLYLSVPIGFPQRIEFNAHRVFSPVFLGDFLAKQFEVQRIAVIKDDGSLTDDVSTEWLGQVPQSELVYGCGIWVLKKL